MRLTSKVYLATALVTTIGALGVGASSVLLEYQSTKSSLSAALKEDMTFVDATSIDALEEAITIGQASSIRVSIAYLDSEQRLSLLHDDGPVVGSAPDAAIMKIATTTPQEVDGNLVSVLKLSSNDYLLFAASLSEAKSSLQANFARLISIYLVTLALLIFLVWLTLRRDLRSIRRINAAALQIADGDLAAALPDKRGNSEIEALSRSLRKMVERLQTALERERKSKATIEAFIGDASHELRTPLTIIRGYSELVDSGDAKLRKNASQKIIQEVDKMSSLVNDLLLLASLGESSKSEFAITDVGLLLEDAASSLQVICPQLDITCEIEACQLNTNKDLLSRFFANVTSNIARYVQADGHAKLSLKSEGGRVTINFEDNGPGLPKEAYRDGIRSFKRFDPSRSKASGGTGLGMSIMAGIAENLGGEVTLSKSKLGGLCVSLQLPSQV